MIYLLDVGTLVVAQVFWFFCVLSTFYQVTLQGTYAGHPALTWGKPDSFIYLFSGGYALSLHFRCANSSFFSSNMGHGSYKKTVALNLTDVSPSVFRGEFVGIIKAKFRPAVVLSMKFFPVKRVQVTFKMKEHVERYDIIDLNGIKCPIVSGGPGPENVLIYHFPCKEDDACLKNFLSPFAKILSIKYQHYPGAPAVSTHIVWMVRDKAIPRNLNNIMVKCWYVGQPVECDICRGTHVAKDCPIRRK